MRRAKTVVMLVAHVVPKTDKRPMSGFSHAHVNSTIALSKPTIPLLLPQAFPQILRCTR